MKTSDPGDEYVGWTVERMFRDAMKRFYSRCWCSMDGKRFICQPVVAFSKWKRPIQIYLAHCLLSPTRYFLKNSYDSYLVSSLTNANFHFFFWKVTLEVSMKTWFCIITIQILKLRNYSFSTLWYFKQINKSCNEKLTRKWPCVYIGEQRKKKSGVSSNYFISGVKFNLDP